MSTLLLGRLVAGAGENNTIKVDSEVRFNQGTNFVNGAIFDSPVELNQGVTFQHSQSPIRIASHSGTFTTTANGDFIPEFTPTFEAQVGESVLLLATVSGRPSGSSDYTYMDLYYEGSKVADTYHDYGNSNWVSTVNIQYSMTAQFSGGHHFTLRLNTGGSNFGNNNRYLHWAVFIGGGI